MIYHCCDLSEKKCSFRDESDQCHYECECEHQFTEEGIEEK